MPDHGTRSCYQQARCRCLLCRAAEATYRRRLRYVKAQGKCPLGATMSAVETWRMIRQLKTEGFTKVEIARRLGQQGPKLKLRPDAITVRNALKVRRLARQVLSEGESAPPGLI